MSLQTFFRTVVVIHPLLIVAAIAYPHVAEPHLSENWRTILAWNGDGGWPASDFGDHLTFASAIAWLAVLITFLVALLAVQVGLFYFRAWARTTYLILTVVFLITAPLLGLAVFLPLEAALYEAVSFMDGFIIAAAYFSPLRREFARKRST